MDVGEDPGAVVRGKVPGEEARRKEPEFHLTRRERNDIPTRFKIDRCLDRIFGGGKTKKKIFNPLSGFYVET